MSAKRWWARVVAIRAAHGMLVCMGNPASAQTADHCWIDAKTGARVTATFPAALSVADYRNQAGSIASSGHASSSVTGQNFFSADGGQTWIDSATGLSTATIPGALSVADYRSQAGGVNHTKHASSSITGQTFVLVPCPPSPASSAPILPVLPFGLSIGLGRRDHGDDRFQK